MAELTNSKGTQPTPTENYAQPANNVEGRPVDTPTQVQTKTEEFEKMLNDQQKITELAARQRADTFDPAEEIAENAIFGQSGLAPKL